jgi:hypothetical protein
MKHMKHLMLAFSAFFLLGTLACNAQQATLELHVGKGKVVLLLDSAAAAKSITYDKRDAFFDKVTIGEMSIQMKKAIQPGQSRDAMLQEYVSFLKGDVVSFDDADIKFLTGILEKMYRTVAEVNPAIFPDTLRLIKTKGRHYGDGVWYTRENCIVIPANELSTRKTNPFTATMYHELFHIYSRLNPEKSAALYKLIGFEPVGYTNLVLPSTLSERVLFNPDGVNFAQKIALMQEDKSVKHAVPIIYANHVGYKEGNNEFFGYLEFNLFEVVAQEGGKWMVKVGQDGFSSTLSIDSQPDFFRQIKDNTGYIIHPDEVLADNFSFIMQERNGAKVSLKFSPAGKQLLKDVEAILLKP